MLGRRSLEIDGKDQYGALGADLHRLTLDQQWGALESGLSKIGESALI